MKILFQGEKGAYSETACKLYNKKSQTIPSKSFKEIFEKLKASEAEYAIIPIENSISGSIIENYYLLQDYDVQILAEVKIPIHHCLIGQKKSKLSEIKIALSHPVALAQCNEFLKSNEILPRAEYDTAGSVKLLLKNSDPEIAAIASEFAAKKYDLKILKRNIETDRTNTTRLFVITNKNNKIKYKKNTNYKTTLIFEAKHQPGSLLKCLEIFAKHNLNLTKIESQPIYSKPWSYVFFVDIEASIEQMTNALKKLEKLAKHVKVLGSYKTKDYSKQ